MTYSVTYSEWAFAFSSAIFLDSASLNYAGHFSIIDGRGGGGGGLIAQNPVKANMPPLICFFSPGAKSLTVSLFTFNFPTFTLPLFAPVLDLVTVDSAPLE